MLNTPHNPTGKVFSLEELQAIAGEWEQQLSVGRAWKVADNPLLVPCCCWELLRFCVLSLEPCPGCRAVQGAQLRGAAG